MANREGTDEDRGVRRLRAVLLVVIALLIAGLTALGFVFVKMLQPRGSGSKTVAAQQGLQWVRSLYGFGPAEDEQLLQPTSVAIAPNGDIYANDAQRSRIMRFTPGGAFKALIHTGRGGIGPKQFVRPASLATDSDGNLYVTDPFANKVIVFDDQNRFVREWQVDGPSGVYVRGDLVYVLRHGIVSVYNRLGESRGEFGNRGNRRGDIDAYQGITADAGGKRIYIADALNQRVEAFGQKGDLLWANPDLTPQQVIEARTASTGSTSSPGGKRFDLPQDIVFDGAGRLVVIDAFQFQLIVIDPKDGRILARYGTSGAADGTFFYPTGIDYDAARDWFAVADTRNNRVQIVRIAGSGESQGAAIRRLLTSPYRYCAPPLLLALLALIVALVTRRRREEEEEPVVNDE